MSITKTIGGEPGRDYATIQLFIAAWGVDPDLPLIQVDDVVAEIYGANSDGSAGEYSGQVTLPAVAANDYTLTFRGMIGSLAAGGQATIYDASNRSFYNPSNAYRGATVIYDNLEMHGNISCYTDVNNTGCIVSKCNLISNNIGVFFGASDKRCLLSYCYIDALNGCFQQTASYVVVDIDHCVLKSDDTIVSTANNCRIQMDYCSAYGASICTGADSDDVLLGFNAKQSILVYTSNFCSNPSSGSWSNTSLTYQMLMLAMRGCNIYKTDGTFVAGQSLAAWAGSYLPFYQAAGITNADPLFTNGNGDYSEIGDFVLAANSPCLRGNQTESDDPFQSGEYQERSTQGALGVFTTFDYPAAENVLSTDTTDGAAGLYLNPAESIVKFGETYGYNQTGAYVPDIEILDPPSLIKVSVASGLVTIDITLNGDSNPVDIYYSNGEWTFFDTVTESGNVTITGLTDNQLYSIVGISSYGNCYSIPSNEILAVPNPPYDPEPAFISSYVWWIRSSIINHVKSLITENLYIEGELISNTNIISIELCYDGPEIQYIDSDIKFIVGISMLIRSSSKEEPRKLDDLTNTAIAALTKKISVFKYGNTGNDDGSLLGCLYRVGRIRGDQSEKINVSYLGAVENTDIRQAAVSAVYEMIVEKES